MKKNWLKKYVLTLRLNKNVLKKFLILRKIKISYEQFY